MTLMIGVRLPARMVRKIDKIANALYVNRSTVLRRLIEAER